MDAVGIGGVAKFLDGPQRHVIGGINARVGVITPAVVRRIVGGGAGGVENGSAHCANRVAGQSASGGGVCIFVRTSGGTTERGVALAGNHDAAHPIKPRAGGAVVNRSALKDGGRIAGGNAG